MIIAPYQEPTPWDNSTSDWHIEPGSGRALYLGTAGASGLLNTRTGITPAAPLTWGTRDNPDYSTVTGWITVTDLDGAGGEHIPGRLLAAYWQGRIWLKLDPESSGTDTDPSSTDAANGDGIYLGSAGIGGLPVHTSARPVYPPLYICPIDQRLAYLKTTDGQWRADLNWEVLANYHYSETGHVYDPSTDSDGNEVWGEAQSWRVTIWIIPVGNIICYHTTRSPYLTNDLKQYAPFANRMQCSAWGLPYDASGYDLNTLNNSGGPWQGYYSSLLPWESDGTTPASSDATAALGSLGTQHYLGTAAHTPGLSTPQTMASPVTVCARKHASGPWGLAYWNAHYGAYWPLPTRPTASDLYSVTTWDEAVERSLMDGTEFITHTQTAQEFRFDPASIEGRGILYGYSAGYVTPGINDWPPNAPPYEILTSNNLTTPNGKLHLVIAGTAADGVLLTASAYAEPVTWADPDPDNPNPPHYNPPGDITPPIGPGAGGGGGSGGSGSGGGGSGGGSGDDEPDSDPVGWPPALTSLPDGIYLTAGSGVSISATQHIDRGSDGRVSNIRYNFTISAGQKKYTGQINLTVSVQLTVSGGGSYTVWGNDETMYYGFTSDTSSTVTWASSYIGGGSDPTTSTVSTVISATANSTVTLSGGSADSESVPSSNILKITKSSSQRRVCVGGVERYFNIYTVALDDTKIKSLAENAARRAAESMTATLENSSVTGSNSGPPGPPTVSATVQSITISGSSGTGEESITGCLPGTITGTITPSGTGSISISGSGSWLYDDESGGGDSGEEDSGEENSGGDGGENSEPTQSRATGSISGTITVKLTPQSF